MNQISIKFKLLGVLMLLVLMIALNIIVIFTGLGNQADDGLLINIAGRQRMLSQKMSKDAFLLNTAFDSDAMKDSVKEELNGSILLFESTLKGFINGGEITDAKGNKIEISNIGKDVSKANAVLTLWQPFRSNLERVIDNGDTVALQYIYENNNQLLTLSNEVAVALQITSDKQIAFLKTFQYIVMILSFILLIVAYIIIKKVILRPVENLLNGVDSVSKGNLATVVFTDRRDEIGRLTIGFNSMVANLKNLVSNSMSLALEVQEATISLHEMIKQTSEAITQVTEATEYIASGTTEQATASIESVKKTTKLEHNAEIILDITTTLKKQDEVMDQMSKDGKMVVHILQEKQDISLNSVQSVDHVITSLEKQVDLISRFTTTISDIAAQTNMLALNAAIEAARAGEMGKGFAVVADEIRKLAVQSSGSAGEIQQVVNEILSNTKDAVEKVTDAITVAKEQGETVENVNQLFNEIDGIIAKSNQHIECVYGELQQLVAFNQEIVSSIEQISSVAETTASSAEEVSASIQQQSAAMVIINSNVNVLGEKANTLSSALASFSL